MGQHNKTPENIFEAQNKDNTRATQLQTIFQFLQEHVATASMVSDETKVPQKNICRYKRDLEKAGRLWEIKKAVCHKTGFKAWYLTTDPRKVHNTNVQLTLF
jgi:hypothetical protein